VSFIDDHTRKVWVYFMKHKAEMFQHFLNFKAMVEKEKGVNIKCLRFDGRGEYFSKEFSEYLKKHGIQRKYSCSYSPQQNGVAKRKNRHIVEITFAMLNEKNLPNYFWAEAVTTAVYIMNRTPTAIVHGMTPKEKFTSKKPDVSHLRVFGCIAYVHVPDEKKSKLDPKAVKCIFIGYSLKQKGYKCFNLSTRKLQVNRDVVFDEMVS
jgi:transposase InsO family protein